MHLADKVIAMLENKELSILYLRCRNVDTYRVRLVRRAAFNSLFEMRQHGVAYELAHRVLSILYLRCNIRQIPRRDPDGDFQFSI